MRTLDRRLVRTVARSRLQCVAVALIIAMGLTSYTLLVNTYRNMDHSMWEYYRQQAFPHIFARFAPQGPGHLQRLQEIPGIAEIEGRIVTDTRIDVGRDANPVLRLISCTQDQKLNLPLVHQGVLPGSRDRQVALLARFAEANDLSVGDEIDLIVRGEPVRMTISGLVDSPEFIYAIEDVRSMLPDDENFGVGFADLGLMQDLLGMPGQVNEAVFLLRDGTDLDSVRDDIAEHLEGRGMIDVITRDDHLSHFMISIELESLGQFARVIPVVFLSIAAAIIYMLISRLVKNDRTTIGVLKAMGYSNRQVLGHYLKFALLLGMTGGAAGVTMGYLGVGPTSAMYMEFFELPLLETRSDWSFAFFGILLTAAFCGGTGLWAAREVLRIVPADAMRPPAPPPGRRNLLEITAPRVWSRLSFGWKLVLRHIVRNKQRFALTVLGVTLTFAVVFIPFYGLNMIDVMFFRQYGVLEVYDYTVSFDTPVGPGGIEGLGRTAEATAVEPFLELPFKITSGWRKESVLVRALPERANLQRFEDEQGRLIGVPGSGILISGYLGKQLGVKAGDEVILSSHADGDREHSVRVRAVISQYMGSGAYVSLDQMRRLTGEVDTYSGALIKSPADVRTRLANSGNVISVFSSSDIVEAFNDYMGLLIVSYSSLVLIGGILGFAILFNTASVSISERAREFSSMRVMGYDRKDVYRVILRENILAWIIGTILGVPVARGLTVLVSTMLQSEMFYFPAVVSPVAYAITAVLVTIFTASVMAAVWVRIKKLNLLEALSSRLT
ncbi:MAG: ABC transporter permease [Bacillota bacterium]